MAQKVQFVETVLRDANQSLIATRLPYDKFAPMLETIDKTGYYAVECWGGATFDVCLRYLNEDPWERLRKIRAAVPNTKLQMLLRGQNVLGYSHYPDDFVKLFVQKSVENGIDIIRIFDALNDTNNLKVAMEATVKAGAIASGTLSYTTSPVHTQKKYVEMVKELKEMGASTICIKDMAGIMGPKEAYDLVSAIKDAAPELPIDLHTHSTTGLAFMTYLKAVEAGADIIMLDNMSDEDMRKAVTLIAGRAKTECSGNVTRENIARLRDIGIDYVSSGALTHSAPILDLSMKHLRPLTAEEA